VSERQPRQRKRDVPVIRTDGFHLPIFRRRAALYVDGFNLFHAVQDLGREYLKWVDLQALGRAIAPRSEVIRKVVWATAFRPGARHLTALHQAYFDALEARGVQSLTGHFVVYSDGCNACGHTWTVSQEKQSDVNLALAVADDAHENRFDVCYLLTTDGDHAATARFLKQRFPGKKLVIVAPPGRPTNRTLLEWADARTEITLAQLERSLLPAVVEGPDGPIERPAVYEPPVVPKQRGHLKLVASD
jgi:hypothetical protein